MSTDDYRDAAFGVLKKMTEDLLAAGIPKDQHPPLLADHLMYVVLTIDSRIGMSEHAALAIIGRMEKTLNDWRQGRPPFTEFNGRVDDDGEQRHPFAALRSAMEHMVNFGGMELDQAAACFGVFALGLVKDHLGDDKLSALVNTWAHEAHRLQEME